MKIFRYPTLRAYKASQLQHTLVSTCVRLCQMLWLWLSLAKVGPEGLNLLYDVPHFEGDHQKSAKELAHWLSERSASWTPPHPEGLEKGRDGMKNFGRS